MCAAFAVRKPRSQMAFVTGSLTPDLGNEGDSIGPRDVPRRKPGPSQLAWEAVPEPGAGNRATAAAGGSGTHPGAREAGVTTANPSPSGSSLCSAGASRCTRSTSVAVALTPTELPGRGQRASSRGGVRDHVGGRAGHALRGDSSRPGHLHARHVGPWGQPTRPRKNRTETERPLGRHARGSAFAQRFLLFSQKRLRIHASSVLTGRAERFSSKCCRQAWLLPTGARGAPAEAPDLPLAACG